MDPMDCKKVESEHKNKNNADTMWETLITTLTDGVKNCNSNMETILDMIKKDLTYDDPGLFPSKLLVEKAERDSVKACNYWLLNQLLQIASLEEYREIKQSIAELQQTMLSASFLKQHWFFSEAVQKYLDFLQQLNGFKTNTELQLVNFHMPLEHLSRFNCACVFTAVEIKDLATKRTLTENCLHVLSQVICLIDDRSDQLLRERCAEIVLATLNSGSLDEKTFCLMFFGKYLKLVSEVSRNLDQLVVEVLTVVEMTLERTNHWLDSLLIGHKSLQNFKMALLDLYAKLCIVLFSHSFRECHTSLMLCSVRIIKNTLSIKKNGENENEALFVQIRMFLKTLIGKSGSSSTADGYEEIFPLIGQLPEMLELLESPIVNEAIQAAEENDVVLLADSSYFWKYTIDFVENKDGTQNAVEKLAIRQQTIRLAVNVSHNFVAWKQKSKFDNKQLLIYEKGLQSFLCEMFEDIKKVDFNTEIIAYMLDICFEAVHLTDFRTLEESFQQQICSSLFIPFSQELKFDGFSIPEEISVKFSKAPLNEEDSQVLKSRTLDQLCGLSVEYISEPIASLLKQTLWEIIAHIVASSELERKQTLLQCYSSLLLSYKYNVNKLFSEILQKALFIPKLQAAAVRNINIHFCLATGNIMLHQTRGETTIIKRKFRCLQCKPSTDEDDIFSTQPSPSQINLPLNGYQGVVAVPLPAEDNHFSLSEDELEQLFLSDNNGTRVGMVKLLAVMLKHNEIATNPRIVRAWSGLIPCGIVEVYVAFANMFNSLMESVQKNARIGNSERDKIIQTCMDKLLQAVRLSLNKPDYNHQSVVMNMVLRFATSPGVSEQRLMHCLRMMFFFLMLRESEITRDATLVVEEMCDKHGVTPRDMFNWYRHDIVKLIMAMCATNYCCYGIPLSKSLIHVSKTFRFTAGPVEFITKYYKIVLAMLLPWCIKRPKCVSLLQELSELSRTDITVLLSRSFSTIYPCLFINESVTITNQCIDYIITNTGNTLVHLLQSDVKKTVSEILIYYHLNAECVLHAFQSLLAKDDTEEITTAKMAEYISGRFLGVLTFFEASLINLDNEKALKRETLLSLGEIIRLLGGHHITPFRFKIIALLKTTMAIEEPNLKDICIQVWRIFICTVDVQQLGPLLSTIFVSLGQYIDQFPEDINYIFHYLVVQNNSLLSQHISDLFFLDQTNVSEEIKKVVAAQTRNDHRDEFLFRFTELVKHVTHENLSVRIYGLKYLKQLFMENRCKLNDTMLGKSTFNPMLEELLNNLIKSCGDIDINYRLSAAECMGELGALAPSYLPPNYAPQDSFALSIHSDAFASMALGELCRAYQSQKDTKYVDSFSLAIQDILVERDVSPDNGKKLDVWHAIPERLRPLMEPLLKSSYTGLTRISTLECHPIFGSSKAQSYQEWAFLWASQMIEKLENSKTQSLLKSFQPSIRCDIKTMAMVLPYILLHAIQGSTADNQKRIAEELQFVFSAVMNNNPEVDSPEEQVGYIRGLRSIQFTAKEHKLHTSDAQVTDMSFECAKLAFTLLDFLERWKRQWRKVYQDDSSKTDFHYVDTFLGQFDRKMLADINFKCNEYARSLIYLEEFIDFDPSRLQQHLCMLARVFTHLNDPDSVEGVVSLKTTEPTLTEQILLHNATGQLNQTAACYECMLQEGDVTALDIHNMVECYLRLDQPHTALLLSESLLNKYYDQNVHSLLQEIKAEPLYRLGRFEELEELLESPALQESDSWGVICGSLMFSYKKNQHSSFIQKLKQARLAVLKCLRNADLKYSAYEKEYEQVLKLHMITEFEKCEEILDRVRSSGGLNRSHTDIKNLMADFESRLDLLQPNTATVEPILSLHRLLLNETKTLINGLPASESESVNVREINETIDEHIGKLWIKSTELASRAKMFDQAHLYILHAENYKPKELFIKKAKLLWERRKLSNAFQVLDRGLSDILHKANVQEVKQLSSEDKAIYAEGKLLIAIYNAEASNVSASVNQRCFKDAVVSNPGSEKSMVHLAQYLDKLYVNFSAAAQDTTKGWELLQEIMTYYGKSMMFGSTYIYQSMPRILSIWLDSTSRVKKEEDINPKKEGHESRVRFCNNMNNLALKFSETLSPYFFFTAFSQLISRVAHPSIEVYQVLKAIIIKLILHYPQQTLWMMLSVYKSSYANRVKRCNEIFHDKKLAKTSVQKLITDFNAMAEKFIELTNKELGNIKDMKFNVSSVVKSLPRLFENANFSDVIMPIQKCMQLVLDRNSSTFSPYPMDLVFIRGIREEAVILPSLQKPRKIALIGHDGRDYVMMMKPKDDLRKDFRLMEFNAVVKQYLYQDPDAKHRRLNIRTYAVLPLNEECGIVEWVQNLNTFRNILLTYYKQRGIAVTVKEMRNFNHRRDAPLQVKKNTFLKELLIRHPPVFGEWFRDRFSNPHNWFNARSSYIRTTAVISIVGYILGLGDRHGENILFDAKNGDTVHVDFNCLFNKGETFEIPELVPFRLTHNMVKAMGPLGIEGPYRRCCEITLRVLQNQTPTLMSVLKPFVYDPLVSWNRNFKNEQTGSATERTDPLAMNNVKHIEERLKGYVRIQGSPSQMPLSVEGQVSHLISEATSVDNLAQMYIGWAGYM